MRRSVAAYCLCVLTMYNSNVENGNVNDALPKNRHFNDAFRSAVANGICRLTTYQSVVAAMYFNDVPFHSRQLSDVPVYFCYPLCSLSF